MTEKQLIKKLHGFRYQGYSLDVKALKIKEIDDKLTELRHHVESIQYSTDSLGPILAHIKELEFISIELHDNVLNEILERENMQLSVSKLPDVYAVILSDKYFNGVTVKSIAKKLCYSEQRIYQLHKEAIDLLLTRQ